MSVNATLRYIHQDHLTGTSVVSDNGGASVSTIKYTPFGETRSFSGKDVTDKKFTGQRLDGTGLYYYDARYYDPLIGRFISPDTIIPNPANPQSFNRYSYCLNNPLRQNPVYNYSHLQLYFIPDQFGVGTLPVVWCAGACAPDH
jgi:RHS repeat-associated protein